MFSKIKDGKCRSIESNQLKCIFIFKSIGVIDPKCNKTKTSNIKGINNRYIIHVKFKFEKTCSWCLIYFDISDIYQ